VQVELSEAGIKTVGADIVADGGALKVGSAAGGWLATEAEVLKCMHPTQHAVPQTSAAFS